MSSSTRPEPTSELGRQLLDAARDEAPSDEAMARVLRRLDGDAERSTAAASSAPNAAASRRPLGYLLAAAMALAALAAWVVLRPADSGSAATAPSAAATVSEAVSSARPEATAGELAAGPTAPLSASASAAPTSSASAWPEQLAQRAPPPRSVKAAGPASTPPAASAKPPGSSAAGAACGCDPADLMCNMRCAEK